MDQEIKIKCQETPNPNALKFIVSIPLKLEGKSTFTSPEQAANLPLVRDLFNLQGVLQIYLQQNTLTLTHSGELPNQELKDQTEAILQSRLPIHDPKFCTEDEKETKRKSDRSHLSEELICIEEILDRTIRPGLQADGGDIEVISIENDEVKIMYQGACGGCPSSMMGTLDAIQNILRHELKKPDLWVIPL